MNRTNQKQEEQEEIREGGDESQTRKEKINMGMSRRQFLAATGAAGAAAAAPPGVRTLQDGIPTTEAETIVPVVAGAAAGITAKKLVAGTALLGSGAVGGVVVDRFFRRGDLDDVDEATQDVITSQIYNSAVRQEQQDQEALGAMQDSTDRLYEIARRDVEVHMYERIQLGDTKTEVEAEMEAQAEETISTFLRRLYNYWSTSYQELFETASFAYEFGGEGFLEDRFTQSGEHTSQDVATGSPNKWERVDNEELSNETVELPDGDTVSIPAYINLSISSGTYQSAGMSIPVSDLSAVTSRDVAGEHPEGERAEQLDQYIEDFIDDKDSIAEDDGLEWIIEADAPDGSGEANAEILNAYEYQQIDRQIREVLEDIKDDIPVIVDSLYDSINDGDIVIDDLRSTSEILENIPDADELDDIEDAAGYLRAAMLPESDGQVLIEDVETGLRQEGYLFWDVPQRPLDVGETVDPDAEVGRFMFAGETTHSPADLEIPDERDYRDPQNELTVEIEEHQIVDPDITLDESGEEESRWITLQNRDELEFDFLDDSSDEYDILVEEQPDLGSLEGLRIVEGDSATSYTFTQPGEYYFVLEKFDDSGNSQGIVELDVLIVPEQYDALIEEGNITVSQIADEFAIIDAENDPIDFPIPESTDPDMDPEDYQERLDELVKRYEETIAEYESALEDAEGGFSFPDFDFDDDLVVWIIAGIGAILGLQALNNDD